MSASKSEQWPEVQNNLPYRVLVTGASGFVGTALCTRLLQQGCEVRAAVRKCSDGVQATNIVAMAALDRQTNWTQTLDGVETVVHLAARVHVMHDKVANPILAYRETNVDATLQLARQAARVGVKRLVFLSSIKVNGEHTLPGKLFRATDVPQPLDAYGQSKHEAEQGLRQIAADTGIEVVIIRPPLVYGPGVKANLLALMEAVQKGWPLPLGAIYNQRSLVALDNLVDFILTCMTHPKAANQTFLISDGQDLSTTELVRCMAQAASVSARLLPMPVWALEWGGRLVGKGDAIQRLCGNLQIDSSKAKELLGWVPKISVQDGLRRMMSSDVKK